MPVTIEGSSDAVPPPDLASLMLTAMSLGMYLSLQSPSNCTDYEQQGRRRLMSPRRPVRTIPMEDPRSLRLHVSHLHSIPLPSFLPMPTSALRQTRVLLPQSASVAPTLMLILVSLTMAWSWSMRILALTSTCIFNPLSPLPLVPWPPLLQP